MSIYTWLLLLVVVVVLTGCTGKQEHMAEVIRHCATSGGFYVYLFPDQRYDVTCSVTRREE